MKIGADLYSRLTSSLAEPLLNKAAAFLVNWLGNFN